MARRAPERARARSLQGVGYSQVFLERLARILVRSGHSPRALLREFGAICRALKEPKERWDPERLNYVSDLPHVMAQWYTEAQYLDSRGAPRALPWRSSGASLSELIREVLPGVDPERVVRSLIELGGVARRGELYVPRGRYLAYNAQTLAALAHGLTALLGMLNTLETNIWGKKRGALFERAAMNPRFPVRSLPAFHAHLKPQADSFVWSIDRDMRRYEERARGERTTRLGVCVFAFENPTQPSRSVPRTNRKARRGSRRSR